MGYTLTSIPAFVIDGNVSPSEYSYLVATESPVIFQFQRNDGDITLSEDASGFLKITLGSPYVCADDDVISIYDEVYDRMIAATITAAASNVFTTDIVWEARYAADLKYILNYTQRQNYYIEGRLTINGKVEVETIKSSPNTKGLVNMDISDFLRSSVNGDKVGNYLNLSDAEINQSGNFTLEYRERYLGDSNSYTAEGNTWYYAYAIRTKEQGSNLWQYVATPNHIADWFTSFDNPNLVLGLPNDIQFFWPYEYADLSVNKKYYDASNTLITETTTALNNASRGYITSVTLSEDSLPYNLDHIIISIVEP